MPRRPITGRAANFPSSENIKRFSFSTRSNLVDMRIRIYDALRVRYNAQDHDAAQLRQIAQAINDDRALKLLDFALRLIKAETELLDGEAAMVRTVQ